MKPDDFSSETWKNLEEHITARISKLHNQLLQDATQDDSNRTRGRILELRAILALATPAPKLPD